MDIERIKIDASGRWFGILDQLGIDVRHDSKHSPCPLCPGGKDRFRMDADGSRYYCNQCGHGDSIALIQKYTGMSFKETIRKISELMGEISVEFKLEKPKKNPAIALNKVWNDSKPLTGDDQVSLYLKSRGITAIPENIRFCEKCYESDTKLLYPAMIAAIHNKKGVKIGIHRTYLEGTGKAKIESPKKIMPPVEPLNGSAIRLSYPNDDVLGIAEGIETALSCTQLFGIQTWSCMTAGLMEKWFPPEGCKKVVVYADNDLSFAGIRSAGILANKLFSKGFSVEIKTPEEKGTDWNDVLMKANDDYQNRG